ncbi:MAG TPA: FkbM family methyltransferase [Bacteroidia bacterium]|nr:FkbM family methyltransferase [Bacteroidia bacterium]
MKKLIIQIVRLYTRYFPLQIGKVPVLLFLGKTGLFKGMCLQADTRTGFKMNLWVEDWVQQLIYFFGDYKYERNETASWRKDAVLCKQIVDIGSNVGYFSLLAASVTTKNTIIIAYEPSPVTFKKLSENINLNKYENRVVAVQAGLSDQDGSLDLFISSEENSGMTSLVRPGNFSGEIVVVKVLNAQKALTLQGISNPDLIKIDVEGNEMNVIKGLASILESAKPVIYIEILDANLKKFNSGADEVYEFLRNMGYKSFEASSEGKLTFYDDNRDIGLGIFKFNC